jgi:hypothetical protein
MWNRVDLVWTDVSVERITAIFRVEKSAIEETSWAGGCSLQPQKTAFFLSTCPVTDLVRNISLNAEHAHMDHGSHMIFRYE